MNANTILNGPPTMFRNAIQIPATPLAPSDQQSGASANAPGVVRLKSGEARSIAGSAGCVVHCVSGVLWLTQEGDARDIVLIAGERFTLDRIGRAVVSAIEPGAYLVDRAG